MKKFQKIRFAFQNFKKVEKRLQNFSLYKQSISGLHMLKYWLDEFNKKFIMLSYGCCLS